MGKGDKKSRRGKLFQGSFGVRRPKHKKKVVTKPITIAPVEAPPVVAVLAEEKKPKKTTKKKEPAS
jgi:30S ribosomal protein S31